MSKTVTLYKCEKCSCVIQDPKDGVVVHGNIYAADPNVRGGLIGNNFPQNAFKTDIPIVDQIEERAYCQKCFLALVFPDLKLTQYRGIRQ